MFFKATIVAFALATVSNAHMIMSNPVPYGKSTLNSSPLAADGSDFPCKQRSGVYDVTTENTMELGGSYDLAFIGSAVHGGGSCQVSITYDENPTAKSTFKVIHSIIGGCPMRNEVGNAPADPSAIDPDTYNFTIPTTLPSGKATLAWTWFNKIGNREMYMNCAPVTFTGGSSKRSDLVERDQAAYNALPDMFVANVGNGCGTAPDLDVVFPNPGDSVAFDGGATSTATSTPTGSCQAASGGASQATGGATIPVATSAASTGTASASSVPGGVFITVPTSAASATSASGVTPATTAVSVPASATSTTFATEVVPATTAVSVPTSATSAATSASPSTGTTTSSSGALTGACTTEGMFNCIDGSSFQQCASGTWSVVESMASGTKCTSGQTMDLAITKRASKGVMRHFARYQMFAS
ncbi:hypothetical protein NHQ30_003652 [Ciborinia camelliae]|nr:hypothetical protein NHQ30_003652 [Ciborinia camelliae]